MGLDELGLDVLDELTRDFLVPLLSVEEAQWRASCGWHTSKNQPLVSDVPSQRNPNRNFLTGSLQPGTLSTCGQVCLPEASHQKQLLGFSPLLLIGPVSRFQPFKFANKAWIKLTSLSLGPVSLA